MITKPLVLFFSFIYLLLFVLSSAGPVFDQSSNCHEEEGEKEVLNRSMFPSDFLFGVATSAYQIEGGYLDDGKGLSNWDVFTHVPGNIANGDNGDFADDHYHRYMEDIETLEELGVNAYRFSISWTRILPYGRFGEVNPTGIIFYNKLINNLLLKGIEPFVTIQHNDIPQELEDRYRGWLSPLIQEDFEHFSKTCFENFGDRVKYWATINEPNILSEMGYLRGTFAPGHCSPPFGNCSVGDSDVEPLIVVHNMLISHAKAVKLYRQQFQLNQHGFIGIVSSCQSYEPYRDDDFSRQAVERALAFSVEWIFDPLIYGDYPPLMRKYLGHKLPVFSKEEAGLVKASIDFIGLNHYTTRYAIDCFYYPTECTLQEKRNIRGFVGLTGFRDGIPIGDQTSNPHFFVVPHGMEKIVDYMSVKYPNTTIYVTENGYAPPDRLVVPDILHDTKRVNYHEAYMSSLNVAMRKGAKVKGYFAWSLMDNFEWADGYKATYGLYYVDRRTLERTPKLSAKWYQGFLKHNDGHHENSCLKSFQTHTGDSSNVTKQEFSSYVVQ